MDGLMFDTEALTAQIWDELGAEMGYGRISSIMSETMGVKTNLSGPIFSRHFGQDFPFEEFMRRSKEKSDRFLEQHGVPVKPGLFLLLDYLKYTGLACAVATSTSEARAMKWLQQSGAAGYFSRIVCGSMLAKSKPEPDIYLLAAKETGSDPKACMALEDSPNGCLSAFRAGMMTVMVPDLVQPDEALRSKLFACLPALSDVVPLLERLNG